MLNFYLNKSKRIKSYLKLLLSFLSLWLLFHLIQIFIEVSPIFSSYMDDLLVLPICLSLSAFLQCLLVNANFRIQFTWILFLALYFGIVFEIIVPKYIQNYTSDPIDFVIYLLGGILFFVLQPHQNK